MENTYLELPTEVQLWRRLISRKDRKYLKIGRKGKVIRGADSASRGDRLRVRRELSDTGRTVPSENRGPEPRLGSTA